MANLINDGLTLAPSSPGGAGGWAFVLHLADNTLMLAQRNTEWTGHGPVLEQDIAITNIALDLLGQSRNFFGYAAQLYNSFSTDEKTAVEKWIPQIWKTYNRELQEDDLAMLREERQYLNLLIAELPRGDWAFTVLRQFFFSSFQQLQYEALVKDSDEALKQIAEKSLKEIAYHIRWSAEWVIRLGDGTDESHTRLKKALIDLTPFLGELFAPAAYEAVNVAELRPNWLQKINDVFAEATLPPLAAITIDKAQQQGGKEGKHSEHFGYLLAELQYLQRTYPNSVW